MGSLPTSEVKGGLDGARGWGGLGEDLAGEEGGRRNSDQAGKKLSN